MSKEEFLQRLGQALAGEVPERVIAENMKYYDEYISGEVRKGFTADEVTGEIGDPRLIARTIIDATLEVTGGDYGSKSFYETGSEDAGYRQTYTKGEEKKSRVHYYDLSKWYWRVLAIVIAAAVVFLVLSVIAGLFSLVFPLLGPILLIFLIVSLIRNSRWR